MAITGTGIHKTKPADKPRKLADSGGLYLLLNPNGSRWWRYKYRFEGKEKLLSLGTYPETSLADAREKHAAARKQLQAGIDPGTHRKATKAAGEERAANSFSVIAEEWLAKQQNMSEATLEKARGAKSPGIHTLQIFLLRTPRAAWSRLVSSLADNWIATPYYGCVSLIWLPVSR
jgi:hypothetical protein